MNHVCLICSEVYELHQVLGIREKFDQIEALAGNKWVALPSSSVSVPAAGKPKNAAKKSVLKVR